MNVFLLIVLLHFVPAFTVHGAAGGMDSISAMHSVAPLLLDLRWSLAVAGVWVLLSLWRGTQLILSAIRLHGLANRATPIHPGEVLQALLQDSKEGGLCGRAAELCTSVEVERPSVFGFFRPRILVPPALIEKLSALELQQVVLHEMEHLRRADDWTNLLQKIGLVLFPLNPVLLWVEGRLCAERELACDDRVLRSGGARKAYAICLTRLAEYSILHRSLTLVLGAWERQSELVRRVHRLLRGPHEAMGARQAKLVSGSLILGVLGGAIALARSPQLVSFVPPAQSTMRTLDKHPAVFRDASLRQADLGRTDFRQADRPPHMVNVNAVMPQRPVQSLSAPKPARKAVSMRNAKRRAAPSQQAWVVVTKWRDDEMPPGAVIAVDLKTHTSYAAVPIMNGWLIVQI
jgi:beta-lactamase regulating signal transducer with metallopeptidase domain